MTKEKEEEKEKSIIPLKEFVPFEIWQVISQEMMEKCEKKWWERD